MTRYIAFQKDGGRYNVPQFVLANNEDLVIAIHVPNVKIDGVFYFCITHGKRTRAYSLNTCNVVNIPADWIALGEDEPILSTLELRNKTGETLLKTFDVEPLIIKKHVNGNTEFFSAIQRIEQENAELRKLYDTLKKRVETYETSGIELDFEE